jgi:hypothetical protein
MGSIISLTESSCKSPYTNAPKAAPHKETVAHMGSPNKPDELDLDLLLLRDCGPDERDFPVFDELLLPRERRERVILRVIMPSNNYLECN